jgi:hypothetical protein
LVASILSNKAEAEAPAGDLIVEEVEKPVSIESLIASYDWDYATAYRIMICESGRNPEALNDNPNTRDYSVGLFQINLYGNLRNTRPDEDWLRVPENNISYAYIIYQEQGWFAWLNCYKGNRY